MLLDILFLDIWRLSVVKCCVKRNTNIEDIFCDIQLGIRVE